MGEANGRSSYILRLSAGADVLEYVIPLDGGIPCRTELESRRTFKRELRRGIYSLLSQKTGEKLPWGILTGIRPAKIVHELLAQGFERQAIIVKMRDYYMLSQSKAELLYEVALAEKAILEASPADCVSIYIGIPFCRTRCLYCSFTSYSIGKYINIVDKYLDALKKELLYVAGIVKKGGLKVQSIYIGGGTPTSITAAQLQDLLSFVSSTLDLSYLEEYTLEAGRPDSIDYEKLAVIKNSAVDRISINPQTMNDDTLRLIGRNHTREDFIKAFELARGMGFNNINTDLIIGLPGENMGIFEESLKQITALGPESITVHTMALKRASRLNTEKKEYAMISEDEAAGMVDLARKYAKRIGLHPYYLYRQKNIVGNLENIGYCKPGYESIYNVQIMEERQSIFAVGAGAITKVVWPEENRIERAFNVKAVEEYITRIDEMIQRKSSLLCI